MCGMLCLAKCEKKLLGKTDIKMLTTICEMLFDEVQALNGDFAANATVIFDAAAPGWPALLTTYSWRHMTGICTGQSICQVFGSQQTLTLSFLA